MRFFHELGLCIWATILVFCCVKACDGKFVTLVVNGSAKIAETDENFICATLDWWPSEKCDYGRCSWGNASLLNLDLENPFFAKAIKAFSPLKIRFGGSLQDKLIYGVGHLSQPCHPFLRDKFAMFNFSKGCLTMERWDKLNKFVAKTGSMVAFGLNALYGRRKISKDGLWGRPWNSSNARNFIQYTVDHGYKIYAWEFGNELSGSGIGAKISATQYSADIKELNRILEDIYKDSREKPLIVAPDGFFDRTWLQELLQQTEPKVLNVVTRHIYNLGSGEDTNLTQKILDPGHLSQETTNFRQMQAILQKYSPWSSCWVGEAGGAYKSGKHLVSDAFVNSFWYLDQLGMSSTFNTKVYCRQSLIGGNYGLLKTTTFAPNPDYYSALLWHRLMGRGVLSVNFTGPHYLRTYAHCTKNDTGVTLLLINLSNDTIVDTLVSSYPNPTMYKGSLNVKKSFIHKIKKFLAWVGSKTSEVKDYRMEYHLTAKGDDVHSQTVLLNGAILELTEDGDIPSLDPVMVATGLPIQVAPLSIAFVSLPGLEISACLQ